MTSQTAVLVEPNVANPTTSLTTGQIERPVPGPGEVLVRVTLRPCNPADIFSLMGVYPGWQPDSVPAVPGLEGTGTVEVCGEGATKFALGQRVVGAPFDSVERGSGTWQQYMVTSEASLVAVPDAVSDEAAAQFYVNPVTVVGLLAVLDIPKGGWLLQTAAGSVLGRQMIQLAKHRGIKTINVVRRQEQAEELKALGADEVVVSTAGEGLAERVKEITGGEGAYAAIECVGGDLFAAIASSVRNGGTAIIYGAMSGLSMAVSIPDVLFRGVNIRGFWLSPWTKSLPVAERQAVFSEIMQLLADKVITPYAGTRLPLEQVVKAVEQATSSARGGKVLLEG